MLSLLNHLKYYSSQLGTRNAQFLKRIKSHQSQLNLHQKTMHIKQQDKIKWLASQSKKQLTDKIIRQGNYDKQVREYIKKFNVEHKGKINLLDFSNYTTKFNDFKQNPISKKDMQMIRQFQKRKIDQKLHKLNKQRQKLLNRQNDKNPIQYYKDSINDTLVGEDQEIEVAWQEEPRPKELNYKVENGLFDIDDDFVMVLLERNMSTKVTTLNRVNYFRTLLFMGNGNGLISYGKSRDLTMQGSMTKAIIQCKKNIIAIPLDDVCTLPRKIHSKFQDFDVTLRPLPGFNSYGHPSFSLMLALSGIRHVGFKTIHTGKNNYTLLHSFFKAVTQNTTPQDMAQLQGFKSYRHRFIRPLTQNVTHNELSY